MEYIDGFIERDEADFHIEINFETNWKIVVIHIRGPGSNRFEYYISRDGKLIDRGQLWGSVGNVLDSCNTWIRRRRSIYGEEPE